MTTRRAFGAKRRVIEERLSALVRDALARRPNDGKGPNDSPARAVDDIEAILFGGKASGGVDRESANAS